MHLHCSEDTEQESEEQDDCLLMHDWLSCSTYSNSNRRFIRRRLWASFTVFWAFKSGRTSRCTVSRKSTSTGTCLLKMSVFVVLLLFMFMFIFVLSLLLIDLLLLLLLLFLEDIIVLLLVTCRSGGCLGLNVMFLLLMLWKRVNICFVSFWCCVSVYDNGGLVCDWCIHENFHVSCSIEDDDGRF